MVAVSGQDNPYGQEKNYWDRVGSWLGGTKNKATYAPGERQEGIASLWTDILRNSANTGGNILNFLTSTPSVAGGGLGDAAFGRNPNQVLNASASQEDPRDAMIRKLQQANADLMKKPKPSFNSNPYNNILDAMKARVTSDPAAIQAIYKSLADEIGAREAAIAANYDTAAKDYSNTANQTTAGTNAMYQSVMDANAKQLADLGIQQAVGTLDNRMGQQQQQAGNQIQQLLAADLAQNTTGKKSAVAGNQAAATAALGTGANKATAYLRALQDQIMQTEAEKAKYNDQQQQAAYDYSLKEWQLANKPTPDEIKARYDEALNSIIKDRGVNAKEAAALLGSFADFAKVYTG